MQSLSQLPRHPYHHGLHWRLGWTIMPDTARCSSSSLLLSDMNDDTLFTWTSKLNGTSTKMSHITLWYAELVWNIHSILLVYHQLEAKDPLSGKISHSLGSFRGCLAQLMMSITRASPLKIWGLTVTTVSSPCGACHRTQDNISFTNGDNATQNKAVNFAGTQQSNHRTHITNHC